MSERSRAPERERRPDVQALRALAVSAVVLFHLWPDAVPGGYVGVDVFFVISGFLITGQLFREIESTGRIGLVSFYARRIRRLLPAAFVVLACTLVLLVLVVPRVVWHENLRQIRAASAYLLNWQLAADRTDYLAADDSPTLVQHYWSLALEEQFYLVWPLLLVLALGLGVRLHIGLRASLVTVLAVTTVVSFAYSVLVTPAAPAYGFFSTQTRAWEFALGGLVALAPAVKWRAAAALGIAAGWAGVGLVLGGCVVLTQETSFPGWAAMVPTGGAALVLAAGGVVAKGSVAHASRRGPFSWLGDHSYAIYLWHWPPIIALPWVLHGSLETGPKLGILAATLLLAWLTKRCVEDPVRAGAAWRARRWASFSLATAGTAALVLATTVVWADLDRVNDHQADLALASVQDRQPCFGAAAMVEERCARPFARPPESVVDFAASDVPAVLDTCQIDEDSARPTWCWYGARGSATSTVAFVGLSYAAQLAASLDGWATKRGVRILVAARSFCLGLTVRAVQGQDAGDPCVEWSRRVQAKLRSIRNLSLVVFATHIQSDEYLTGQLSPGLGARREARSQVLGSLRRFDGRGVQSMVLKHPPGPYPMDVPECVARSFEPYDPCARPRGPLTRMDMVASIAQRHPRVTRFVSLDRFLCDRRTCHAVIGGVVAYFDRHHLSDTYARTLTGPLARAITRAVRQPRSPHGW